MVQKKLQKESQYESLDMNNDGVVDDNELAVMQALDIHEKNDSQKRMAWVAMIAMLVFTASLGRNATTSVPTTAALCMTTSTFKS